MRNKILLTNGAIAEWKLGLRPSACTSTILGHLILNPHPKTQDLVMEGERERDLAPDPSVLVVLEGVKHIV